MVSIKQEVLKIIHWAAAPSGQKDIFFFMEYPRQTHHGSN